MKQDYIKRMSQAMDQERSGDFNAAEASYREILGIDPHQPEALHALAIITLNKGDTSLAYDLFSNAVKAAPGNALFHRNLGELSRRLGKLEQAMLCGKASAKLDPSNPEPHYNLGLVYTNLGDMPKAIAAYRKAVKLNPQHGLSWNNLGSALEQQGNKKSALSAYEKAAVIDPRHAEAQNNRGALYSEMGKLDDARTCFNAAISANPQFVEAHYNLSSLKTYTADDPHLLMLQKIYSQRENLTISARIRYAFAIGKALDDIGRYDQAFAAYDEGNKLQHSILPVNEASADTLVASILSTFSKEFFKKRKKWLGEENPKKVPIFIVGMPRSGTTLLEQILSSHQSVYGAGELVDLNQVIHAATGQQDAEPFANQIIALSEEQMRSIGKSYLERVWKLSPKSRFITDKMPANFFYLGIIHLALPNAKIIHAMRDPMDSCFSCYSRLFNDTMEFAYNLDTLANYYRRYMTLMRHWHEVLPKNTILDLAYEDLVADTEAQARRVLNFVGLPWDDKCLDFHKNERLVKTASVAQVRKPIYKTSVARWRHFRKHLQPLLQKVSEFRVNVDSDEEVTESPNPPITDVNASRLLIEQSLQLQGKSQHQEVIDQLSIQMPLFRGDVNEAVLLHLLGISLYRLDRFALAKQAYEEALKIQPNFPSALNSLGFLLQDMGFIQEAKRAFERALELAPELAMARLNLGMAQLKLGDFERGLENYEARWTGSAESALGTFTKPNCPLPLWTGEQDTHQKSLLVITEQGFGDAIQYSRYLDLVSKRFMKVGFVCSAPTLRLMEWAFNHQVTLFTHLPRDYVGWDYQCALMSLPRMCKTRLDSIPNQAPYLKTPTPVRKYWQDRLAIVAPGRFRVGIAWAGRPIHQYDSRRSLRFEQILPLLKIPAITWVSLQKWTPQDVRPTIPQDVDWIDWTEELQDFGDTAGLVENLDLIISIDSSMVHLAGALNKPVWMLNRFDSEWRWLDGRSDSPWYPSLRIFKQPSFGDWASVIGQVALILQELPRSHAPVVARQHYQAPVDPVPNQPPAVAQNNLSIEQALQLANQLQVSGRLNESEKILKGILQVNPKQPHALHLLGIVTYQAGQIMLGLDLVRQAIAVQPQTALFESNLAEMSRQQGRVDEAVAHGKKAVEIDPTMASAHSNLGIALFDAKNYDDAEICHSKALSLIPNLLQSLNNMGSIERARGNKSKALEWYRKALSINPDFLEALTNIGAVLVEDEHPSEAIEPLLKVLNVFTNSPEALCNLGLAYFKLDDYEKAAGLLRRSLENRPGYVEALIGLSRVLHKTGDIAEAEALLLDVLKRDPERVEALSLLGLIYTERSDAKKAELTYSLALNLEPDNTEALIGLANLRLESGDIAKSEALLNQTLTKDPKNIGARFHLSQTKKASKGDSNLIALEEMLPELDAMAYEKQISVHYALGKLYDDLGEFDKAFPHFAAGAKLKRAKLSYIAEDDTARTNKIIQTFTPDYFANLQGGGNSSKSPIFVLGMPRSGTTLTEQIISSHPKVFGAGELHDFLEIAHQLPIRSNKLFYPDNMQQLNKSLLTDWGNQYIERTAGLSSSPYITDKMPANYMALGFIPLVLPNAKIIHIKRNPVDTCLSCFTRLFNRHQDATYDLVELGKHYMNYSRIMDHWKSVLPKGSFIEVQYEDIVSNMEDEARRMIDLLGLDWDDACLAFHKNKRHIRTASVTQVRQPIYSSSVERWRHYEKYLGPLLKELTPILS